MEDCQKKRKLLRAAPRQVRPNTRRAEEIALQRVGVIAYVGFGIILLFNASLMTLIEYKGVAMPASVVSRTDESDEETPSYRVNFRYQYDDMIYFGKSNITKSDYDVIEPGMSLMVRALPIAPSLLPALQGFHTGRMGAFCLDCALLAIWAVGAWAFVWSAFFSPRNHRLLLRSGVAAVACITEKTTALDEDTTSYVISYEFLPEGVTDADVTGKRMLTQEQYDALSVGDPLTAFYDAKQPHCHVLYAFADYYLLEADPKIV
ncbi:MAG: hypothetical protein ABIY70_13910 [Capsulimonas sp.]|uniref:hypothetical protein n=1 Tax=Capsulimonas sp. TaxID=2494211 RepID=UPI003262FE2C